MLPFLLLLAPAPPSGTTSATVLCDWLSQATGMRHEVAADLSDYPLFLSVHASEPERVKTLVATALAGEWAKQGATIRLVPTLPKPEEGFEAFARQWKKATATRPTFAALSARDAYEMKAGEIVRFGLPTGPFVRPLPEGLRREVEKGGPPVGGVYLRRLANGSFETRNDFPGQHTGTFSEDSQIGFRDLPPEMAEALGDAGQKPALSAEEQAAVEALIGDMTAKKPDPMMIRFDPLARFVDPYLDPVAKTVTQDMVVALPDFTLMALITGGVTTVRSALTALAMVDDWTVKEGAFVGRLPVSERRNRSQTRRSILSGFLRRTGNVGISGPAAMAQYLAGQRPQASESWVDVLMLGLSGVAFDQSYAGDYPFNLRLGAALSEDDWAKLRTGEPFEAEALSPNARRALTTLLVQSRQRMSSEGADPVRWPDFPNAPLMLSAKVTDEDVLMGIQGGMSNVMTIENAGFDYRTGKKALGSEPLYRPGRRRTLVL
ncbi:hypothetical protein EON79_14930, partial [bacterium]